jgi:hypothetical protein
MPTIGETTRPGFVYDSATDTWIPVGIGPHSHTPAAIGAISSSVVTTKGDLIVGTGSGTVVRQGVGADGSYLVADSTQNDGVNWAGPSFVGAKNFVVNGGFDFWQRGTTFASPLPSYTADRFAATASAGGVTYSVSRVASFLTGSQYALRVQRAAGQTGTPTFFLGVGFETIDIIKLQGKTVTWSFYVQAGSNYSSSGSVLGASFYTGTGIDQGPFVGHTGEVTQVNASQVISTTGTRYSYTFTVPTNATSARFNLAMPTTGTAGANDYYDITNMQLEIGSVATPFSRAGGTIAGELAACQRYYWRAIAGNAYGIFGTALGESGIAAYGYIMPNVQMRAMNSITSSNIACIDGNTATAVTLTMQNNYVSTNFFGVKATAASGLNLNRAYQIQANNNGAAFVAIDGEL